MVNVKSLAPALLLAVLAACAAFDDPTDYDRHRFSDLKVPREGGDVFYYDVTVSGAFPADDPKAEATRERWLDGWLKSRGMCAAGYDIVKKRPFGYSEDNPAHRDLRYEVRCKPVPDKKP
jgi:hypothetical protein